MALPKHVKLEVKVFGQGLNVLRLSVTSFGGPVLALGDGCPTKIGGYKSTEVGM